GSTGRTTPVSSRGVRGTASRTSGATDTRAAAAATLPVASRYCVVAVGLTATVIDPSLAAFSPATSCQVPPDRCCSWTGRPPRATPVSRAVEPYVTGVVGALSDRTPTVNHVERRPRTLLSFAASIDRSPAAVVAVSVVTRPDELTVVRTSLTAP